jgi:hypothetical protein
MNLTEEIKEIQRKLNTKNQEELKKKEKLKIKEEALRKDEKKKKTGRNLLSLTQLLSTHNSCLMNYQK